MTLYLTDETGAEEIRRAAASGRVIGVKLYPAGATTNSAHGVTDLERCAPALGAMQECGLVLMIHGEVTGKDVDVFDRERVFVERTLEPLVGPIPRPQGRPGARDDGRGRRVRPRRPRRRGGHHHRPSPAPQSQRAVRGRTAPPPLLPAGAQARAAPGGAGGRGDERRRALLPRHGLRAASPARQGVGMRLRRDCIPRMPESSSTRKRSTGPVRSVRWRRSHRATARRSTGSRRTAGQSPCAGSPGRSRARCRWAATCWCRSVPGTGSHGVSRRERESAGHRRSLSRLSAGSGGRRDRRIQRRHRCAARNRGRARGGRRRRSMAARSHPFHPRRAVPGRQHRPEGAGVQRHRPRPPAAQRQTRAGGVADRARSGAQGGARPRVHPGGAGRAQPRVRPVVPQRRGEANLVQAQPLPPVSRPSTPRPSGGSPSARRCWRARCRRRASRGMRATPTPRSTTRRRRRSCSAPS